MEPICQAHRVELITHGCCCPRTSTPRMELAKLVIVSSKDERAGRTDCQQLAVQAFGNAEPLLDAPLAYDMEMVFRSDYAHLLPCQAGDFRSTPARPEKHLCKLGCDGHAIP